MWSRILEKLITAQLSRNSITFTEPESSLSGSEEPAISPCPELDESSPPSTSLRSSLIFPFYLPRFLQYFKENSF
jgi:hypothetical protein